MAISETPTLLSLDSYAKIIGINPMHFNGATAPDVASQPMYLKNSCQDLWCRWQWQNTDRVSWEDLSIEIENAERELTNYLGYPPALTWVTNETQQYPKGVYRELAGNGVNIRGDNKIIQLNQRKFVSAGRRGATLISNVTTGGGGLVFSDGDGDGLTETVTITVATTVTDKNEIKVFFAGNSGDPAYEIRPLRSVAISGGVATIELYTWQIIDPDLWDAYPTEDGAQRINLSTTDVLVSSLDVYRIYNDQTQASAVFYWGQPCYSCGGAGCVICEYTSQNGCLNTIDPKNSLVWANPGSYDSDSGSWVPASSWTEGYEPDIVSTYYRAGDVSERYRNGYELESMPRYLARAIAYLATARLERNFCQCGNVATLAAYLRDDLAKSSEGSSYTVSFTELDNPFGTRRGEIMAYKLLRDPKVRIYNYAVI